MQCALAVLMLVGCRWHFATQPASDDAGELALDAYVHVPFPVGTPVAELNLMSEQDDDPTLTSDMLEIYFDSSRPATGGGLGDIWRATRTSTALPFDPPQPVIELLSIYDDTTPDLSPDGLTIYFGSDRAAQGDRDPYVSTRPDRASPWSPPVRVSELSSTGDDSGVCESGDGLTLFMSSTRGGLNDILEATRPDRQSPWGPLTAVPGLADVVVAENQMWCNPELTIVYFTYQSPAVSGDIYMTSRVSRAEPFGPPVRLDEFATAAMDADPWLSPDFRTIFYFNNTVGSGDIYTATR